MKKLLVLVFVFYSLNANAQNYLITFAGAGESTTVNSVKVDNLTTGTSLVLNGSDILRLTVITGVNSALNIESSELKIFPNPMTGSSVLQIHPQEAGSAVISIYDMTGKQVALFSSYLENNLQEFRISGLNSGLYLISVRGSTYQFSGKLLSNCKEDGTIRIEKIRNNLSTDGKIIKKDSKGTQAIVDMAYTIGERIKFTGTSGNFSTVKIDIPDGDTTITFDFTACTDGDNNNYPVVTIGTQTWMAENLNTSKFSDGTIIPFVNTPGGWDILVNTDKAFCYLIDNQANADIYGALYTWGAAMNGSASSNSDPSGVQGVCPTGWHLPSDNEWTTLINYLGGTSLASGKLRETGTSHWPVSLPKATNESGFTALPGGYREDWGFYGIVSTGFWWSSFENSTSEAWSRGVDFTVFSSHFIKKSGCSVRCIKD